MPMMLVRNGFIGWLWLVSGALLWAQSLPDSVATLRRLGLEGRVIWVDATANLEWLIDRERVRTFVQNCRRVGLNTIVLDVKPVSGHVLFRSQIAPPLSEWRGIRVPPELDILQMFLEEAHAVGLEVHASLNVLSEGHKVFHLGPGYEHPEWQMVAYSRKRTLVLPDGTRYPLDRFDVVPPPDGIAAYRRRMRPRPLQDGVGHTRF
jgi:hypothetical protein